MLKADTKTAMLNYQKLYDSTEANQYLENFARK
jgi:DNA repair exonuclease SbcCD ATPase subunit